MTVGTIGIPASGGSGGKFQVIVHCDVGAEVTMENSTVISDILNVPILGITCFNAVDSSLS